MVHALRMASGRARPWGRQALTCAAALLCTTAAQAQSSSAERALQVLKSMSDFMTGQRSVTGEFEVDIDVITPDIEKIQFTSSGSLVLARPDRIHVIRKGGHIDLNLISDGRTVTLIDSAGSYAQIKSPGTIEQVMTSLRKDYGIEVPLTDVVLADSFDALMAGVRSVKYIGTEMLDGVECEHLWFRNVETDWQLWVRKGDRPFPCRYIISSKTVAASPQYTIRYRNWASGEAAPATAFTFTPSNSSKLVAFDKISSSAGLLSATTTASELTGGP